MTIAAFAERFMGRQLVFAEGIRAEVGIGIGGWRMPKRDGYS